METKKVISHRLNKVSWNWKSRDRFDWKGGIETTEAVIEVFDPPKGKSGCFAVNAMKKFFGKKLGGK